jgi:hypothetical protein
MDIAALAAALAGAQCAQTQLAMATQMVKMNAQADASVVKLIAAAQQNSSSLANVAAGVGGTLDISA